jgi:hypothetical protein
MGPDPNLLTLLLKPYRKVSMLVLQVISLPKNMTATRVSLALQASMLGPGLVRLNPVPTQPRQAHTVPAEAWSRISVLKERMARPLAWALHPAAALVRQAIIVPLVVSSPRPSFVAKLRSIVPVDQAFVFL